MLMYTLPISMQEHVIFESVGPFCSSSHCGSCRRDYSVLCVDLLCDICIGLWPQSLHRKYYWHLLQGPDSMKSLQVSLCNCINIIFVFQVSAVMLCSVCAAKQTCFLAWFCCKYASVSRVYLIYWCHQIRLNRWCPRKGSVVTPDSFMTIENPSAILPSAISICSQHTNLDRINSISECLWAKFWPPLFSSPMLAIAGIVAVQSGWPGHFSCLSYLAISPLFHSLFSWW